VKNLEQLKHESKLETKCDLGFVLSDALLFSGSSGSMRFVLFACNNESQPHTYLMNVNKH
jgi:hypothetical protein